MSRKLIKKNITKASSSSKKRILHSGKYFNFVNEASWEYFERNNCSAIVIIWAVTDDNKVIFVEQFRPPVNKKVIEFPAGLVNDKKHIPNESILKAAKRELLEETGYLAKKIIKVMEGPVSCGATSDIVTMVRAYGLKKVNDGGGDELEDIIVHEIELSKVNKWLASMRKKGYLIEPKIYTGLYFLNNYDR